MSVETERIMVEAQKGGSYPGQTESWKAGSDGKNTMGSAPRTLGDPITWNYPSYQEHPKKDLTKELPIIVSFQTDVSAASHGVAWRSQVSLLKTTGGVNPTFMWSQQRSVLS